MASYIRNPVRPPAKPFVPQHGMSSQTPASQHLVASSLGPLRFSTKRRAGTRKKKRAAGTARSARARRTTSRRSTGRSKAHLVKGSAAAKRYMAKIRRKKK